MVTSCSVPGCDRHEDVKIERSPVLDGGEIGTTITPKFETKDSGEREEYDSGMRRDTQDGKPRFDLIIPVDVPYGEQMLTRWAALMARGAAKYGDRNWEKGDGQAELDRAKGSALRHLMQWFAGETDEDHAAAVFFNIQAAEYFRWKQRQFIEEFNETVKKGSYSHIRIPRSMVEGDAGGDPFARNVTIETERP